MRREFKFRIWIPKKKGGEIEEYPEMTEWDVADNIDFMQQLGKGGIILQYIGLKDKNKKKIYEGDIMSGKSTILVGDCRRADMKPPEYKEIEYTCTIVFQDGEFKCYKPKDKHYFGIHFAREQKIIGNIYANPELLK